jgi:acyl-CoA oxidase
VLTLCIRLFSELLLQRYHIPLPDVKESLLAWHASSLLRENMDLLKTFKGDHRSDPFNSLILPQSQSVIEAIGHALAYSAAKKAKLPQPILDVYESAVVRQDPAWYSEETNLSRKNQRIREDAAVSSMMPQLSSYLSQLNIEKYVSAPIVSDVAWKEYLEFLPVHTGTAFPDVESLRAML